MSSEWVETTLAEFADINPKRPIARNTAAPFIEMAALPTFTRDISVDDVPHRPFTGGGSKFSNGDTLLARITPCLENGKTALVSCLPDDVCGHGSTEFIVLAPRLQNDKDFLYYLARSEEFRAHAISRMEGTSGRQRVPNRAVGQYTFFCPPEDARKNIGDFLSSLDDRITLLRETNATLEAIAQALFKSWFVDFDPVRAKMEGRAPEGMDEATAALFPDGLQESALGLVPRGWRSSTLGEVSVVGIGKTPPRKEPQWFSESANDVRWVSIRDMGQVGVFASQTSEFLTQEAVERFNVRVVPDHTTLMSFKMTIGRVSITDGEMTTNEAIAHFKLDANSPVTSEFIYLHLKQFDFSTLSSTSSIADAVNSKSVQNIPILIASSSILAAFQDQIGVLFKQLKVKEKQAQTLATLRDTLLPRLISGQLRLPKSVSDLDGALA